VTLDLGFRHTRIVFERKRCDRLTILVASADSRERHGCPNIAAATRQYRRFSRGVKRLALQSHSRFHALNLTP
jgi:hypothetical protein